LPPNTLRLLFYVQKRTNYETKTGFRNFGFVTPLLSNSKYQFYPQILSIEASFYIYDKPLTEEM